MYGWTWASTEKAIQPHTCQQFIKCTKTFTFTKTFSQISNKIKFKWWYVFLVASSCSSFWALGVLGLWALQRKAVCRHENSEDNKIPFFYSFQLPTVRFMAARKSSTQNIKSSSKWRWYLKPVTQTHISKLYIMYLTLVSLKANQHYSILCLIVILNW